MSVHGTSHCRRHGGRVVGGEFGRLPSRRGRWASSKGNRYSAGEHGDLAPRWESMRPEQIGVPRLVRRQARRGYRLGRPCPPRQAASATYPSCAFGRSPQHRGRGPRVTDSEQVTLSAEPHPATPCRNFRTDAARSAPYELRRSWSYLLKRRPRAWRPSTRFALEERPENHRCRTRLPL